MQLAASDFVPFLNQNALQMKTSSRTIGLQGGTNKMAVYHLSAQIISRAKKRNVVACAAYRAGERLADIRCQKSFHWGRIDIDHTEILVPDDAPG